jgi:AraC-like DNA-binding protein
MIKDIHIGPFDLFIFLGVFQGLLLSWFLISNSKGPGKPNLFQGLLILSFSAIMFEEVLNNTGYIVKMLSISNFAESLNFAVAPLFYLYIKRNLRYDEKNKDWLHFIIFFFYLLYMCFYFVQSDEYKYNSYIDSKHPDWPFLNVPAKFSDDPLGIRNYVNEITAVFIIVYFSCSIYLLIKESKKNGISLFKTENLKIRILRNSAIHFIVIILIFLYVKMKFPGDVGDYFISTYMSFMIISTSYRIFGDSSFFEQTSSFLDFPMMKYKKSSLSEEAKQIILKKIENEFTGNRYYLKNLASLNDVSKILKESPHHVSQVINEQLKMNFFELLAKYRVEEAKRILFKDKERKITIEEIAEKVGYNSKSAFNNAFKKITSKTPSEFRDSELIS